MGKTIVFPPIIEAELKRRKVKTLFVKSLKSKDCRFSYGTKERKEAFEESLIEQNFKKVIFHAFDWNKSTKKFHLPYAFWGDIHTK